jgi:rod shape-determining protein MreC
MLMQQRSELARSRELLRHERQSQTLLETAAPTRAVVATVLSRSTIPTQQTILLDKGSGDGLSPESIIIDAHGVVGRVIELHPRTCLVLLLTDAESQVAGLIERSRESGLLVGRYQGWCELTYLDVESDVKEGDQVITAGLGGAFPKGLPLGTVMRVVKDEPSGKAWARVKPAARLGRLEEVLCLSASRK